MYMARTQKEQAVVDYFNKCKTPPTAKQVSVDTGITRRTVYDIIKKEGLIVAPDTSSLKGEGTMNKQEMTALVKAERDLLRTRDKLTLQNRKYKILQKDYIALRKVHDAVQELGGLSKKRYSITARKGSGGEATPLIQLSDWHVEEEVKANRVNFLNKFNLDIAEKRAKKVFERTLRLIRKEQQDISIHQAVINLNGDFISGNIHEELLASCLLEPIFAIRFAEDLLTSGIQFLLDNSELDFIIPCKVGNHTRITNKVHIAGEAGNSLETAMYHSMKNHFKDEPRITFIIDESYLTHLKVYGKTVRIHHGHALRYGGGVGGLHIPLRKAIAGWNETTPAFFDMLGHFHQYGNTTPRYNCNGSLIGYNAFALWIKGNAEPPMQSFTLLDKKRGITAQYPIHCE